MNNEEARAKLRNCLSRQGVELNYSPDLRAVERGALQRIAKDMRANGATQDEIATYIGASQSTVSRWLNA